MECSWEVLNSELIVMEMEMKMDWGDEHDDSGSKFFFFVLFGK